MSKTHSKISVAEARQLHENWMETRAEYIKNELGEIDAFEFSFSVQELKQYLEEIEQNSLSSNPGVRIYLGATMESDGSSRATIFLTPTKSATANAENDYGMLPLNRIMRGMPPRIY